MTRTNADLTRSTADATTTTTADFASTDSASFDAARWAERVRALAEQRNAVILAHNYQIPEIQDIAHHTGDSLALSRQAAETDADIIVFCGVHFMAESAKILSPDKKVLIPDARAGCSLADSITAEQLTQQTQDNPTADLYIHPECGCANSALYLANEGLVPEERVHMLSTGQMITRAQKQQKNTVLVATETGMLHQLNQAAPDIDFRAVNDRAECKFMKMITPQALERCLETETDEVTVPKNIADAARKSLEAMISIGNPGGAE